MSIGHLLNLIHMYVSLSLSLSENWKDVLLTPYGIKFSISFSYDINNILYIIYKNNSSNNNNKSKVTQKRSKTKATLIQRQPRKHEWEKQRCLCLCYCCAGAAHKLKIRIYMQNLLEFQTFFASFIPVSCLLMYSMCVCVSRVCVYVDLCASICSAKLATTFDCECTHCLTRSASAAVTASTAALYPTPICSIQTTVVVAPLSALSHTGSVCLFLYSLIFIYIFMRRCRLRSPCFCCCCWYFIYFEYIYIYILFTLSHCCVVVVFMQSFVATQFKTTCNWRILVFLSV